MLSQLQAFGFSARRKVTGAPAPAAPPAATAPPATATDLLGGGGEPLSTAAPAAAPAGMDLLGGDLMGGDLMGPAVPGATPGAGRGSELEPEP